MGISNDNIRKEDSDWSQIGKYQKQAWYSLSEYWENLAPWYGFRLLILHIKMILLYVKEKENLSILNIGNYSFEKICLSAFHILCFTQNPYFFSTNHSYNNQVNIRDAEYNNKFLICFIRIKSSWGLF